ncbi:MAG: ABC transporter permease [Coriobacteriia bacterium]|nr:ABC transporter permease [Coriobacteriia bacterium]
MKWLVLPAFWLVYWGVCFLCTGTDEKNLAGLRSYPDEVQAVVCERLGKDAPGAKSIPSILLGNLLLFTVLFSALGLAVKNAFPFGSYLEAFWYFLLLGEGLGLFDLIVIDLLWWRSTSRIRFSYLPDAAPYQDPTKHIGSFVRGIPLFVVIAALSAAVVTLL